MSKHISIYHPELLGHEPQLLEPIEEIDEAHLLKDEPHCPHGNVTGDCSTCDHLGDLAHDAAREARLFR
jgi:hypothetical protein